MYLEIITPDKRVFEGEVDSATFPGTDGYFQILNNHAALISTLGKGPISYKSKKFDERIEVNRGVVEVLNNRVIALVESLVDSEDED
ncbi:MAG: F0F1 ATP synthase subunit epsilon [Cyclobacteriaceae bacterium]|nr:F0F1 ATP synthase subunit epsilon [Cyclobacteriaceae bacterium]